MSASTSILVISQIFSRLKLASDPHVSICEYINLARGNAVLSEAHWRVIVHTRYMRYSLYS